MFGENGEDGALRAEVTRVDDVHSLLDGTLRVVVLHIARDVDIRAAPHSIVDKVRPRTAADGDAAHGTRGSGGEADVGHAKAFPHRTCKVLDAHRGGDRSDAPDALGHAVFLMRDDEGGELFEPQARGKHVVHAAACHVEVRMRRRNGDVVRDEGGETFPKREVGAQLLDAAKDRGVVCDDHVRPAFDGFRDDGIVHVKRNEHTPDLLRVAADEEAGVVPVLGEAARRNALQCVHDELTAEHNGLLFLNIMQASSAAQQATIPFRDTPHSAVLRRWHSCRWRHA